MKQLIILLTLISFTLSVQLTAKERSDHRERKQQKHSRQEKQSRPESRQKQSPTRQVKSKTYNQKGIQSTERMQSPSLSDSSSRINRQLRGTTESTEHIRKSRKNTRDARRQISTHAERDRDKSYTKKHSHIQKDKYMVRRHANNMQRKTLHKQKHRRHRVTHRDQDRRYHIDHYRGNHRHGRWHSGHGHYHYDYQYRHLYNPYQWYDDYYYTSYFDWRWNRGNHRKFGFYYNDYYDPYYCPDAFSDFVAGLAIGTLIYNW